MRNSQISAAGLIAAIVIATLAFAVGPAKLGLVPTLAGLVLLAIVLAFDRSPARSFGQSLAYGAACGFLIATAAIYPLLWLIPQLAASPSDAVTTKPWLPAITLIGTVLFLGIDRVRTNSRPVVVEIAPPPPVTAQPSRPEPVRAPVPVQTAASVPAHIPVPAPEPQPVPTGRPATIYLNLTDAGITCLRAVKAEYLAKDFYKIVEPTPPGETWEFQTGQIVRCRKKTLSSGKAMVAFEEAQRLN